MRKKESTTLAAMTAVALLLLALVRRVTPVLPQQGSYHPRYGTYIGRLNAYVEGISGRVSRDEGNMDRDRSLIIGSLCRCTLWTTSTCSSETSDTRKLVQVRKAMMS